MADEKSSDFEKIESKDRDIYWDAVVENKVVLLTQLSNGTTVMLTPLQRQMQQLFVSANSLPDKDPKVLVSFSILKERLFISTQLSKTPDGKHFIDTFGDLFRLQRRENFRIVIPEESPIGVFLNQLGDKNVKIKAKVIDLSLGGTFIEFPDPETVVSIGDTLSGIISTDKEIGIQFKGIVKHTREFGPSKKIRAGVYFEKLVGNGLGELNKLIMKYYHKMFSKFSAF
ncbi:MAG: hypothetical protein A4S09_16850 [Proteobacteria bacterium SG_bin7]|nr:MAG: hypothetical protein A4S09_16850 [Proteobacteria bacterium SG_bin7]